MKAYLARQPIYTCQRSIYGYELLYRSNSTTNTFSEIDDETATRTVVSDAVMAFGMDRLTNGKPAFVNFNKELIMGDMLDMVDKANFVIEILEDVIVDDLLIDRVRTKSEEGYVFALDDYVGDKSFEPLLPFVKIIKVDFALLEKAEICLIARQMKPLGITLLAEKVETEEDYNLAEFNGYTLFQGYYFDKPAMLTANLMDVQSSTCIRVFNELSSQRFDMSALAKIIRNDVNLTYKLLKHSNSLKYHRGHEINSVTLALTQMGSEEVRRWITLIFMRDVKSTASDENIKTSLVRGLMLEWISTQIKLDTELAFLLGMFSMIDIIANDNIENVLDNISISPIIKDALQGKESPYTEMLNCVIAYEKGDWDNVLPYVTLNRLPIDLLSQTYIDAVKYTDNLFE